MRWIRSEVCRCPHPHPHRVPLRPLPAALLPGRERPCTCARSVSRPDPRPPRDGPLRARAASRPERLETRWPGPGVRRSPPLHGWRQRRRGRGGRRGPARARASRALYITSLYKPRRPPALGPAGAPGGPSPGRPAECGSGRVLPRLAQPQPPPPPGAPCTPRWGPITGERRQPTKKVAPSLWCAARRGQAPGVLPRPPCALRPGCWPVLYGIDAHSGGV